VVCPRWTSSLFPCLLPNSQLKAAAWVWILLLNSWTKRSCFSLHIFFVLRFFVPSLGLRRGILSVIRNDFPQTVFYPRSRVCTLSPHSFLRRFSAIYKENCEGRAASFRSFFRGALQQIHGFFSYAEYPLRLILREKEFTAGGPPVRVPWSAPCFLFR